MFRATPPADHRVAGAAVHGREEVDALDTTGCAITHAAPSTTPSRTPSEPGAARFAAALRTWRLARGLSQTALAQQIMYSRSLVNLVENGYRRATEAFARAADAALDAGGQLHAVRTTTTAAGHVPADPTRRRQEPDIPLAGTCAEQRSHRALAARIDRVADRRDDRGLSRWPQASRPAATRTRPPLTRRTARGAHTRYKPAPRRLYRADLWRADGRADQIDIGECARASSVHGPLGPDSGVDRPPRTPHGRCCGEQQAVPEHHTDGPDISERSSRARPRAERSGKRSEGAAPARCDVPAGTSPQTQYGRHAVGGSTITSSPTGRRTAGPDGPCAPCTVGSSAVARVLCDPAVRRCRRRPNGLSWPSGASEARRSAPQHLTWAALGAPGARAGDRLDGAAAVLHVAAPTSDHADPEEVVLMRTAVSDAAFADPSADVVDTALWLHGAELVERHRPDPATGSGCVELACRTGGRGTCWVRPFARRLMVASSGAWVQRWTARHDARSCGLPVPDGTAAVRPGATMAIPDSDVDGVGRLLAGVR
ncbi:helix-turn-helix transcriptional regulator [Dactylosporangium vinaceum]|nr:helix-turn-helix transcriptional regulator [Dactylosporangium vinaceum]